MRTVGTVAMVTLLFAAAASAKTRAPFVAPFERVVEVASTVPSIGDVNPYGVAVVPRSVGKLVRGHVLVSNFNDPGNDQGTGTTIVDIAPDGTQALFAQISAGALPGPCPGGIGLTTALVVLRRGVVVVGSLPTTNGMTATAQAGCLLVLDATGTVVATISGDPIDGPWDMTAADFGGKALLFVTNVLNGPVATSDSTTVIDEGTVVRISLDLAGDVPTVGEETVIGSGFGERSDPMALVVGPTGLGLGGDGVLYVADTIPNRIAAIGDALRRTTSAGTGDDFSVGGAINQPLGLAVAPDGDVLVANASDGNLVDVTQAGTQVVRAVNPAGGGSLFGLALAPQHGGVYLVDDAGNALDLLGR